ncbi:MAG: DNA cytosine methyltransferase [Cyclobacteriaceae bacterium]|nr:DNA cytosine methyltransferase [Cyclobacteriaceae bacterium]
MEDYKFIDLFAGAGGLSEGFIKQGFTPIAHVELDKSACFTLRTRTAYHYLSSVGGLNHYYDYLQGKLSRTGLYRLIPENMLDTVINAEIGTDNNQIFSKIDAMLGNDEVDLIVGGPPCQAYSIVGRALQNKKEGEDERTTLYIHYGRFLKKYSPKAFVFENVPGILTASDGKYFRNLQKYYKSLGYEVKAKLLNAHDFSVIQQRERVIIVGWRKDCNMAYPDFTIEENVYSRDDIFLDLQPIQPGNNSRISPYDRPPSQYLKKTGIRGKLDFVSQHVTRPHNSRDLEIYKLAIKLLEKGQRIRNNNIPESIRTQKNVTSFLDRFKVVGEKPHTMIAHIAKDGHHYIHPDIKQLRSISVREAARIQSFPDDYYFEGIKENQARSAAFRQIGNAVPPLMSEKIAARIMEMIKNA